LITGGFTQVWLDENLIVGAKSQAVFGLDAQLSTSNLNFNKTTKSAAVPADEGKIPHLPKALVVVRHLMRHFLSLILTICLGVTYGQSFTYPSIKSTGQSIIDFVPAGWTILDSAYGDLNKDGAKDAAIIIQHKDSISLVNNLDDSVLTQPRMLLILFKRPANNSYELTEQSSSFILKNDNPTMDDPYQDLAITNGTLEIKFQLFYNMGSWYVTNVVYKFRYQQGQFLLIGADNSSFHRATHDFEDYSYNFLTKKRALTTGNDNKGTKKTTWKSLNISELKTLKAFSEPFTWEVETDIYL